MKGFKLPLEKGQHGYVTQSILDFVQLNEPVRYRDMDKYYLTQIQGKPDGRSSSFNHHLQNLIVPKHRRCSRYLCKGSNGLYTVHVCRP